MRYRLNLSKDLGDFADELLSLEHSPQVVFFSPGPPDEALIRLIKQIGSWAETQVITSSLNSNQMAGTICPPRELPFSHSAAWLSSHLAVADVVIATDAVPLLAQALGCLKVRPPVFLSDPGACDRDVRTAAFSAASRKSFEGEKGIFQSFMQGGFECSTHRRSHDRRRLDIIAASNHDFHALHDLQIIQEHGIRTVREGLRWHLAEPEPGKYDWSSIATQVHAAASTGTQVIWDLMHYGWPDHLDIWSDEFPTRFALFAATAARRIRAELPGPCWYTPINEISFLSWAGAEVAAMNPSVQGRGSELKRQLVRASIAAIKSIRHEDATARFMQPEPAIHVVPRHDHPEDEVEAELKRQSQYEAWDMIAGRLEPELGGDPSFLDVVGINYYVHNQWYLSGDPIDTLDPKYRPLRNILTELHARYNRPVLIAETGIEGDQRPHWLRYVAAEAAAAMARGVPVQGLCLYPILDHPGWLDERYCPNGLIANSAEATTRQAFEPLSETILACGHAFDRIATRAASRASTTAIVNRK